MASTTITFDDQYDTATVETSHRKWKTRLENYGVEPDSERKNGINSYEVPINWVRIQRPAQRVWTQAEKDAGAARLAAARAARFGTPDDEDDEEDAPPPRRNGKVVAKAAPAAKAKAKPVARRQARVVEDEDDEDEDIEEFDDEEEEDEPVEVVSRKPAPKGRVQIQRNR